MRCHISSPARLECVPRTQRYPAVPSTTRCVRRNGKVGRGARDRRHHGVSLHADNATSVHVIVMPGFLIPSDAPIYRQLVTAIDTYLDAKGQPHTIDVVPMALSDWLKIALLGNDFRDYLDRAANLILNQTNERNERNEWNERNDQRDQNETGVPNAPKDQSTIIVGHSAGGWVARLLLGADDVSYNGRRYDGLIGNGGSWAI